MNAAKIVNYKNVIAKWEECHKKNVSYRRRLQTKIETCSLRIER